MTNPDGEFERNLREALEWHFDPETGSQFWLDRLPELGFDPVRDIRTAEDLARFPDFSSELRDVPVEHLIPRGLGGQYFRVYDSGGTSGSPKRVIDSDFRRQELLAWTRRVLLGHGMPATGNWLHAGPTGPHVVAFHNGHYAELSGGVLFTIDMDPRFVKRMLGSGKPEIAGEYVKHLLDQVQTILSTQDVAVMWTTPSLLERMCSRPELQELVAAKVGGIVWGGTSFSEESLRELEENFFPDTAIIGMYGNTLMGAAPQRPRQAGDEHACIFEPHGGTVRVDLLDENGRQVEYGERGQVRFHLASKEMFLPGVVERDTAIRIPPRAGENVDGLAQLYTLSSFEDTDLIEGVY